MGKDTKERKYNFWRQCILFIFKDSEKTSRFLWEIDNKIINAQGSEIQFTQK